MTTGQKELPAGWKWVKLGDVCEVNPRRPSALNLAEEKPTTFIPMTCVDENSRGISRLEHRPFAEVAKGYAYFEENDVLYAKITPCMENGKHAIARGLQDGFGFGSTEFHVIRVGNESIPDWIHQYITLPSNLREAKANFRGTAGQKRVPKEFLYSLPIPLPPLEEQKRIAGILNKADELKKLREEADKKTEELIPAIFHEMVGSRIKKDEELPAGWKWVKLGEVCEVKGGKRLPKGTGFSVVSTGYPYIRVTDFRTGSINAQEVLHISAAIQNTISSYTISSDDVYISIAGTIGLVGRVPHELSGANLTENAAKIVINSLKVNSDFLVAYLRSSPAQAAMVMRTNVVAQPKLALTRIRTISIPLPPLEEQMQIVDRLNGADEIKKTNAESNTKIEELQSSLLQRAFRGEL